MLQYSKIIQSREEWRLKASERADELREYRKAKKRHLKTIADLKLKISTLEQANEGKKNL